VAEAGTPEALEARQLLDASLPPGFVSYEVASGISNPTGMEIAPDGRIFVAQQDGQVRIVQNGQLLPAPLLALPVNTDGERGLESVALDPNFAQNGYLYAYYTTAAQPVHNQVVRVTLSGNAVVPGSELVLFDMDPPQAILHNGGAMHFGPDGKLYIAVGDGYVTQDQAQSLSSTFGKILRINPDGTIPTDNPFYNTTQGKYRAIWAYGLRNPFTFAFQPGTGTMLIDDVGFNNWEEVNVGAPGANYGWPLTEGPTTDPRFVGPIYAYPHSGPDGGCAITGGTFYNPVAPQFPAQYVGSYFFVDFCNGKISQLDPHTGAVRTFASGMPMFPVDLDASPDGSLYFLVRGVGAHADGDQSGGLYKVEYPEGTRAPRILVPPQDQRVPVGSAVAFTVNAIGESPLSIQWQRDGQNIPGANGPVLYLSTTRRQDDGAIFQAVVANASGLALSAPAHLTVVDDQPPRVTIGVPRQRPAGRSGGPQAHSPIYNPGETVTLNGQASDRRDGRLPVSALTWQVDLQHNQHAHPFVPATSGTGTLQFTIPTDVHEDGNIWYRVYLTATDSAGLKSTAIYDVYPSNSPLATLYALQHPTAPTRRR
jgi:glucose/arabinose dehydrogenase